MLTSYSSPSSSFPSSLGSSPQSPHYSPTHAASLVNAAAHSREVLQMVAMNISMPVIEYLVDYVFETVNLALKRAPDSHFPGCSLDSAKFTAFVSRVLSRAEVAPSVFVTALVYIKRARPYLDIAVEEWAFERVFLGSLIVASKYTNDSTLKNVHWAACTGVFRKRDIGRIEREFLEVLDWELGVSESDLLVHYAGLLAASTSA